MPDLKERVQMAVSEPVVIVPSNKEWPEAFEREKRFLLSHFPQFVRRIEHFGSTAVPGLAAKPVIDMLVEVASLEEVKLHLAPQLVEKGYDYFWRPTSGNDTPPWYAWFIKRDRDGVRSHHIHMVERDFFEHWKRLEFRDYLRLHPDAVAAYELLKRELAAQFPNDRVAYSNGKTNFIMHITALADADRERLKGGNR
jgi:GrpB-like predicted nucleotidyltransferase (UPF0157 family)